MNRFLESAAFFDPRGKFLAVARSLLALAQLGFILFTPDRDLLLTVPHPGAPGCIRRGAVGGRCASSCRTLSSEPQISLVLRSSGS